MPVISWRAWYDGGRVFTSEDTQWEDLPEDGVQAVMLCEQGTYKGRHLAQILMARDTYFKAGDIYGCNDLPPDVVRQRYPGAQVKLGRWTTVDDIHRIEAEVAQFYFPVIVDRHG